MRPLARVRQKVIPLARGRVVEIGVGTGLNFEYYRDIEGLWGVEPDPHMLARARRRAASLGRPVQLEQCGAEQLPFPTEFFDTGVVTWVLCTIPDPEAALAELRRVLKPGATVLYAEHTESRYPVARRLQHFLTPAWQRIAGGCRLDRPSIDMMARAGFAIEEVRPCGRDRWTLLPLYRGIARRL